MSTCPNCGSKFESGKFRCPNCGSLLVYEPTRKKPSFWYRFKGYKNILILIGLAVLIAAVRMAAILTNYLYLLLIAVAVIIAVVLWSRNKRSRSLQQPNRFQQNRAANRPITSSGNPKKHANVIPFRKRKTDSKSNIRQD